MADVICRWRNATPKTVCEFVQILPHEQMSSELFRQKMGDEFFHTPYQLACQLGLYYEDKGKYIPRFTKNITEEEARAYLEHWIHCYYAPNPYTKSLKGLNTPVFLIEELIKYLETKKSPVDLKKALTDIFHDNMGNLDIITNALNNYSKVICVKNGQASLNINYKDYMRNIPNRLDKEAFFKNFDAPNRIINTNLSFQQIFYGAPGTGKSYTINDTTKEESVIRTTFHPDTDYSTFVGAYKPTTIEETVMTVIGTKAVPVENADGTERKESKIIYEFVAQSFLQAYIAAWKSYAEAEDKEPEKQFLVIEEINRGNCAQIFGDLFQLLDRNEYGFSEYPIQADSDMKKLLSKTFNGLSISRRESINAMFQGKDVVKEVLDGNILLLPNNLYIWATMNTSDQSLFPIDSAFKRRWDWTYIPISNANKGWTISINKKEYDWWQFLEKINELIGNTTNSEDKKLGYFFCKAQNNIISAETFVSKVIFYLWNDVFKDYDFCDSVFNDADGHKLTFDKFYTAEGKDTKIIEERVELFLNNLGLTASADNAKNDDEDIDAHTIIKVNDIEVKKINAIPYTAIEEYVRLHSEMPAHTVVEVWKPFNKYSTRSWVVCNKEEHNAMNPKDASYSYEIKCADGESLWVNKDGWMHHPKNKELRDTISEFKDAVNAADLGVTITEQHII